MHTQGIHEVLAEAIVGRHLLTHPFYRRWEAGSLSEGELAAYAEQYRHIERELPVTLSAIASALTRRPRACAGRGEPRRRAGYARAACPSSSSPSPMRPGPRRTSGHSVDGRAVGRWCARPRRTTPRPRWPWWPPTRSRRPTSPRRSQTACARHYGFDAEGTRFWDVHRTQETEHAGWSMEALARAGGRSRRRSGRRPRLGRLVVALPQRARGAGARPRALLSALS